MGGFEFMLKSVKVLLVLCVAFPRISRVDAFVPKSLICETGRSNLFCSRRANNARLFSRQQTQHDTQKRRARTPTQTSSSLSMSMYSGPPLTPAQIATKIALTIPSLRTVSLSCLLPTCLGYYKSEYGVSYGYGLAISTTAMFLLRGLPELGKPDVMLAMHAATWHARGLWLYGIRLATFLLSRELQVKRFREFRERIEQRSLDKEGKPGSNRFFVRTPFILSCALLYACMSAPAFITVRVAYETAVHSPLTGPLVTIMWAGFLMAAYGDAVKSQGKLQRKNDDALITEKIYKYIRHPNYTGEAIGWTCSFLAALASVWSAAAGGILGSSWRVWKTYLPLLSASACGLAGILFVLANAGSSLELKQKKKYGGTKEYEDWVKTSWAGITRGQLEDKDVEKDTGKDEQGSS